jgi:hypothetical protein
MTDPQLDSLLELTGLTPHCEGTDPWSPLRCVHERSVPEKKQEWMEESAAYARSYVPVYCIVNRPNLT